MAWPFNRAQKVVERAGVIHENVVAYDAWNASLPDPSHWPGYPDQWRTPCWQRGCTDLTHGHSWNSSVERRVSTVFACVDVIARSIGTMWWKITKDSAPQPKRAWVDNPEPLAYASSVDFVKAAIGSLLLRGEAFIACTARLSDGYPGRFLVLDPDSVNVEADIGSVPVYSIGGRRIPREDILHLKYEVWPGDLHGYGPLEAAARNIMGAARLEKYANDVTSGVTTSVLETDQPLSGKQAEELQERWMTSRAVAGGAPAVLTAGLKYRALNLSPKDMALLQIREFDEQRIAAAFGVPLYLVGLPMQFGLTYSTAEMTMDFFWRATLRPLAMMMSKAMSIWLLPRGWDLIFDSDQLTRAPLRDRADAYKVLLEAGVVTVDEVRLLENFGPMTQGVTDAAAQNIGESTGGIA